MASVHHFQGGLVGFVGIKTLEILHVSDRVSRVNENNALLFAAGLITGEALVGIFVGKLFGC